ncbi:hypothetical protein SBOR_7660 [Sclerotinia borealis F-4128]|uniref:Uncharacterized protein n=1 Tax=Sclerotinia borealis (strain F-4128) TaxID=1432307 RepID=W9C7X0_SCLBF|nr:hypothetical protein SBOR_7660 [Sclerotinia borealis F-4128]
MTSSSSNSDGDREQESHAPSTSKRSRSHGPHPSFSEGEAKKMRLENKDKENVKFEKIRSPAHSTCGSQSVSEINERTKLTEDDHDVGADADADADADPEANHEIETETQATAHIDSLDPLNPAAEEDDARRYESLRAGIKHHQKSSSFLRVYHGMLAGFLLGICVYYGASFKDGGLESWCEYGFMAHVYDSLVLLFLWELYIVGDLSQKSSSTALIDIRNCPVEDIPDSMLMNVLDRLRLCQIKSYLMPFFVLVMLTVYGDTFTRHWRVACEGVAEVVLGAANGTANATAHAFVNATAQA